MNKVRRKTNKGPFAGLSESGKRIVQAMRPLFHLMMGKYPVYVELGKTFNKRNRKRLIGNGSIDYKISCRTPNGRNKISFNNNKRGA